MHPEEFNDEMNHKKKESLIKRKIRVFTLRHPDLTLKDLIKKQLSKQQESEDDPEGGGDQPQQPGEDGEDTTFDWTSCYVAGT
jgi:hypothetical protein